MVDILSMVDLTSISAMLAAIGVLVGVVFAILELRNLVKTRQTDMIMRLYTHFSTKEFLEARKEVYELEFEDYNDYTTKYGKWPPPIAVTEVCMFYEGIGVLLHQKLLDIDIIMQLFSVELLWEKMKPVVKGLRKQFNDPRRGEWFEFLYNETQKRRQRLQQIQQ